MRLHAVGQGDEFSTRLLFHFISFVSGMRLPDAARIVVYHKEFYGNPRPVYLKLLLKSEGERFVFCLNNLLKDWGYSKPNW